MTPSDALERHFRVMGSDAHVLVVGGTTADVEHAVRRLDELERSWSRFLPESEISRLNDAAGSTVRVGPETETLLARAFDAHRLTEGAYDPTVLEAMVRAGYADDFSFVTEASGNAALVSIAAPGLDWVELAPGRARLPSGTGFDPGGIGKGLAADLVVREVLDRDAAGISVNVGGDVVVAGRPPHPGGWATLARDVTPAGRVIRLATGAVATSSIGRRAWADRHHVIDPSTGLPADGGFAAVSVVAGAGWWAEALCTAFTVLGRAATRFLGPGEAAWGRTRDGELVEMGAVDVLGEEIAA